MTLVEVKNLFVSILPSATFHYQAWSKPNQYIVWAEDGQTDGLYADDKTQDQVIEGTIDLFTKTEYDPIADTIQEIMNNADMTWRLNSVQYEEDTKYIHHEWVFEIHNFIGGV